MKEIFDRVKKVIVAQLDIDSDEIQMDSTFVGDLGADSLDIVELVMAFEEEFYVEIPDDAVYKLETIGDVVSFVENPEPILNAVEQDRAKLKQIADRVKEIIAAQLGIDEEKIKSYSTWADLEADSLDRVELLMAFEEEFNIEIPDEVAEKVETITATVEKIFCYVYGYQAPYDLIKSPDEEEIEDKGEGAESTCEDNETGGADGIVDGVQSQSKSCDTDTDGAKERSHDGQHDSRVGKNKDFNNRIFDVRRYKLNKEG